MYNAIADLWNLKCKFPQFEKLIIFNKSSIFLLYNGFIKAQEAFFINLNKKGGKYELQTRMET